MRIKDKFQNLQKNNKKALISFIVAGDPDYDLSLEIMNNLVQNGTDIIEIGLPFLDPAGDGPIIEEASKRAVHNGATLGNLFNLVKKFRQNDQVTPIVLMGYYNPIYHFGEEKFAKKCKEVGIDGLLIVDLPLEEAFNIREIAKNNNLDIINLIGHNSSEARIKEICENSSGFIYLVSILGITGTKEADISKNIPFIEHIKKYSNLPIALGFGIKNPDIANQVIKLDIDAIVIGSPLVEIINNNLNNKKDIIPKLSQLVQEFSKTLT
jgi:tryptophan synthase alpha chain